MAILTSVNNQNTTTATAPRPPRQPILPYAQLGQPLPLIQPQAAPTGGQGNAVAGLQDQATLNTQVLQTGQTKALGGFQSPTSQLVGQRTNQMLAGQDGNAALQAQNQQRQLESYDVGRAGAIEAMRGKLAPVSNTSGYRDEMMDLALSGAYDRAQLENQLQTADEETDYQRGLEALRQGRETAGQQEQFYRGDITDLLKSRETAEPEAQRTWQTGENALDRVQQLTLQSNDIQGNKDIIELQGRIKAGELLNIQDFEKTQNALDRAAAEALQRGDIAGQLDIKRLQGEIDTMRDNADRTWKTAERIGTQIWEKDMQVSQQDYLAAQKVLDKQHDIAMQSNDIAAQKYIEDQKIETELQMQLQGFAQDEKMTRLDDWLATARANGDVTRQKQILTYQSKLKTNEMIKQGDIDTALETIRQDYETARQNNDLNAQEVMQSRELMVRRDIAKQENDIANARLRLEEKGFDWNKIQAVYNNILTEIDDGRVDPEMGRTYLNSVLENAGIKQTLTAADPAATQKAMVKDMLDAQAQWALTHPGYAIEKPQGSGNVTGLTPDGLAQFTAYYNDLMYDESATAPIDSTTITTFLGANQANHPKNAAYQTALKAATDMSGTNVGSQWDNNNGGIRRLVNPPAQGITFKSGGNLFYVTGEIGSETGSDWKNAEYFTIRNVATGQTYKIFAGSTIGSVVGK